MSKFPKKNVLAAHHQKPGEKHVEVQPKSARGTVVILQRRRIIVAEPKGCHWCAAVGEVTQPVQQRAESCGQQRCDGMSWVDTRG